MPIRLAIAASAVTLITVGCTQNSANLDPAAAESSPTPSPVPAATAATPGDQPEPEAEPELAGPAGPEAQAATLQEGNDRPKFELITKPSAELADNRISLTMAGSSWLDLPYLQDHAEDTADLGAKWVNSSLYEVEPPIEWGTSEYDIPPEFDRFVDALVDHGISIDYVLHFWDKEGRARGETLVTPRFADSQQIDDYVDYARFIVRHFKGRVANYTIWSEPDNCGQDGGIKCVEVDDYVELARAVIPVIREEDPQATVGIAPVVLYFERNWLPAVLGSDVTQMFDVVQWHGQYGPAPDDPVTGSYYYEYPGIVAEIRQVAEANGFRGEYWSTEMGWCAADADPPCANPDHPWDPVSTDKVAAKYLARAVVMHLGMDIAAGISREHGSWYEPTERRLATVMAGATATDRAVDVSPDDPTAQIRSFWFDLPDGMSLFAIWTDGVAVDDDPGVPATLTFPGAASAAAVGVDVLHGFEQEMATNTVDGDLVIEDILIKDYPTMIRFER